MLKLIHNNSETTSCWENTRREMDPISNKVQTEIEEDEYSDSMMQYQLIR